MYVAGFPCTPYSLLHWQSLLLEDPNVRQLWKVLQNIADCQPAVTQLNYMSVLMLCQLSPANTCFSPQAALLENVMGFKRCWEKVKEIIGEKLPKYLVQH